MTSFPWTSANIRLKVGVKWPGSIVGTGGVAVETSAGVATASLDYPSLADLGSIADPSGYTLAVYDTAGDTYREVSVATMLGAVQGDVGRAIGDSNVTLTGTDRFVYLTQTLTAARTVTLPAASAIAEGADVVILDASGGINGSNTLTIQRAGTDTINGGTTLVLANARNAVALRPDPAGRWSIVARDLPAAGTITGAMLAADAGSTLGVVAQPGGRLTLTTATPVMTANTSAATAVLYTPYLHDRVPIYDGTRFNMTAFTELTNTLSDATKNPAAAAAASNYDLFVWSDSGTIRLSRGPAWTSATARGTGAGTTELERVGGFFVNKAAITNGPAAQRGTYVGTVRTDSGSGAVTMHFGANSAGGTAGFLGVWNAFNRVNVRAQVKDTTATWTYATATIRSANNSTGNRVSFVCGLAEDDIDARYQVRLFLPAGAGASFGVAFDATNAFDILSLQANASAVNMSTAIAPAWVTYGPQLGFHFVQATERGDAGTTTFAGAGTENALTLRLRM